MLVLQHNTCPVCRKELPVDHELQQQQQQERQQRLQQEVQRQPAGLQSLFGALNPFHLFGGGGQNGARTGQAASNQATGPNSNAGNHAASGDGGARASRTDRLPAGTVERLENVQTALRELEVLCPLHVPSDSLTATKEEFCKYRLHNTWCFVSKSECCNLPLSIMNRVILSRACVYTAGLMPGMFCHGWTSLASLMLIDAL